MTGKKDAILAYCSHFGGKKNRRFRSNENKKTKTLLTVTLSSWRKEFEGDESCCQKCLPEGTEERGERKKDGGRTKTETLSLSLFSFPRPRRWEDEKNKERSHALAAGRRRSLRSPPSSPSPSLLPLSLLPHCLLLLLDASSSHSLSLANSALASALPAAFPAREATATATATATPARTRSAARGGRECGRG